MRDVTPRPIGRRHAARDAAPDSPTAETPAAQERFRIASYPGTDGLNPYIRLFYGALAPYGIEFAGELVLDRRWFQAKAGGLDAIHIHWPEALWRKRLPTFLRGLPNVPGYYRLRRMIQPPRKLLGVMALRRFLRTAAGAGLRIIWTFHNTEHHEGADALDRAGYRALAAASDLVICHSVAAREECLARYRPRDNVVVMRIGNYAGTFPQPRCRRAVLQELKLSSDRPVVCCVGQLRTNKGLELACDAVARLGGEVQLVVGGQPTGAFDVKRLRARVAQLPGAVLLPRRLSNQEFADIVTASDAVLLPYREITGSAALLSALTLGRGVIAADLPYFREMLAGAPQAAALFEPGNAGALADAIRQCLKLPEDTRNAAARRLADSYDWSRVIQPVVEAIGAWRGERPEKRFPFVPNGRRECQPTPSGCP